METIGTVRTFEPVKIEFGNRHEVRQTDYWKREVLPEDKVTETQIILEAALEFRGLKQGFQVLGKIEVKGFDIDELESKVKAKVVADLPNRIVLDFFRTTEVTVKPKDTGLNDSKAESKIDDINAPFLEEQAKAGNEAAKELETAIQEINDGFRDGFQYNERRIRGALVFMTSCNRAANYGFLNDWCEDKLSRIQSGIENLAKRKNANHPVYIQTASEICGYLSSWPSVTSWREQPPRRPKIKI
jgi:hypothetical protein